MNDNVRPVDFGSLEDIPAQMEAMAGQIRAGRDGKIRFGVGVFLTEDGVPIVCGWGVEADDIHSMGLLQLAGVWLAMHRTER